ncbi:MAG TPA: hypothetical protein VF011_07645 [Terriglobales bacterium]
MNATAVSFIRLIPDWNSLDSVRHAHSLLEADALVFFALLVVFDVLAHFSEEKKRERLLEKIGLCFFAVAVLAEIAAYPYGQQNDHLSEQVIGSLDAKAKDALANASNALTKAGKAETKANDAETKSGNAATASSNAQALAKGARKEADSFEQDIVSAKKQAANAESHLADALKQAADATRELNLLKSPRVLTNPSVFSAVLKEFAGTPYTFKSVNAEEEAVDLLKAIDGALQLAGWKREKPSGTIVINVYGGKEDFGVPPGVGTGVTVDVDSAIPAEQLNGQPHDSWPPLVRAAAALQDMLNRSITPSQAEVTKSVAAELSKSPSPLVRIAVGKKP